jgi:methylmalonyl-CoA/ethylmalonyl-CoA epimerase
VARFLGDFGLQYDGDEVVEAEKTATAFFSVPATHIELVAPLAGTGPIASYLEKRGGGLHHLCFRTDDIDADVVRLRDKGYQFIGDNPSPGAHGARVIFIHPKSCGGVLIELSQPAEGAA